MARTKEEIQAGRQKLRDEYGDLLDHIAEILFRNDPIGINFDSNTDEYEPEASTILPKLRDCHSIEDTTTLVYDEFLHWFGPKSAGTREKYLAIADEVWIAWQNHIKTK
jgi:hypothetical protein